MDLGKTDLMVTHAVVTATDIVEKLTKHRARYISTRGSIKEIYAAQTERYAEAYKVWTQKQINDELTEAEKKAKPLPPNMPPDRSKEYDRYIALYTATKVTTVYLSEARFVEFFLDEWDFIRTHVAHLGMLSSGDLAWLDTGLSAIAANALLVYS